jgi:hypothetical protein
MDENGTNANDLRGGQSSLESITQQSFADGFALKPLIDGQASQQDNGHGMSRNSFGHAFRNSGLFH